MGTITYREFTPDDFAGIHRVALESWRATYANFYDARFIENFVNTHYAAKKLKELLPQVRSGRMHFHVAVDPPQVVGFCNLGFTPHGLELWRLYLLPSYIGRGVGRGLLECAEAFVTSHGSHRYSCLVHKENELAKNFYLRNGFVHVAERDLEEDWYMEKSLATEPPPPSPG
jgi:ribosomal protein S18 acetylase RimI-like enzyme